MSAVEADMESSDTVGTGEAIVLQVLWIFMSLS